MNFDEQRKFLSSLESYKEINKYIDFVKDGNQEVLRNLIDLIVTVLSDKNSLPIENLLAVRLTKDLMSIELKEIEILVEDKILPFLEMIGLFEYSNPDMSRGSKIFGGDKETQVIGKSYLQLTLECLFIWGQKYEDTKFSMVLESFQNKNVKFPENFKYFSQEAKLLHSKSSMSEEGFILKELEKERIRLKSILSKNKFYEEDENEINDIYIKVAALLEGDGTLQKNLPQKFSFFYNFLQDYEKYQKNKVQFKSLRDRYLCDLINEDIINLESRQRQRVQSLSVSPGKNLYFKPKYAKNYSSQFIQEEQQNQIYDQIQNENNIDLQQKHVTVEFENKDLNELQKQKSKRSVLISDRLVDDSEIEIQYPLAEYNAYNKRSETTFTFQHKLIQSGQLELENLSQISDNEKKIQDIHSNHPQFKYKHDTEYKYKDNDQSQKSEQIFTINLQRGIPRLELQSYDDEIQDQTPINKPKTIQMRKSSHNSDKISFIAILKQEIEDLKSELRSEIQAHKNTLENHYALEAQNNQITRDLTQAQLELLNSLQENKRLKQLNEVSNLQNEKTQRELNASINKLIFNQKQQEIEKSELNIKNNEQLKYIQDLLTKQTEKDKELKELKEKYLAQTFELQNKILEEKKNFQSATKNNQVEKYSLKDSIQSLHQNIIEQSEQIKQLQYQIDQEQLKNQHLRQKVNIITAEYDDEIESLKNKIEKLTNSEGNTNSSSETKGTSSAYLRQLYTNNQKNDKLQQLNVDYQKSVQSQCEHYQQTLKEQTDYQMKLLQGNQELKEQIKHLQKKIVVNSAQKLRRRTEL